MSYHLQPSVFVVLLLFFALNCKIFRAEDLQADRFLVQLVLFLMGCYGKSSALENATVCKFSKASSYCT